MQEPYGGRAHRVHPDEAHLKLVEPFQYPSNGIGHSLVTDVKGWQVYT